MQAVGATSPGGHMGFVGVDHDVSIPGSELFLANIHVHGGPAPVRRFLPEPIQLIWDRRVDPGKGFDLTLPLEQAAEGDGNGGVSYLGTFTAVDCDADRIPQEYDYVLVVSAVYQAPANAGAEHCRQSAYDARQYWSLLVDEDATLVRFTTTG